MQLFQGNFIGNFNVDDLNKTDYFWCTIPYPSGIRTHRGTSDDLLEFGRMLYLQATTAGFGDSYSVILIRSCE